MPIDTSIYQLAGRVKSVQDFDREAAQLDAEKQQQQLGALNLMLGRQKADEYTRGIQRANALRTLAGTWNADTTDEQRVSSLRNAGFAPEADSLEQSMLKRKETAANVAEKQSKVSKEQLDMAHSRLSTLLNVISSAKDQASYTQGRAILAANGFDVSQVPEQYDPNMVAAAGQQAMTALQRVQEARQAAAQAETQRHNKASEALTARGQNITAETARRGQDFAQQQGKVPAGYRTTDEGNLEAIPGGPADLKIQGQLNQDTAALTSSMSNFDRLAQAANELKSAPGLKGITGLRGAIPNAPGSAAADAEAKLNTLKSQVGFGVLQDLRNNSKTGGALGAVSDAEGKRLEANLAALEKAQSYDQMVESLDKIVKYTEGAKDRLRESFNLKHKGSATPSTTLRFDAQGNPVK